jgi:hypothetical protein
MTPLYNTDLALWENYREQYPNRSLVLHDNGAVSFGRDCLAFFNDQDESKKLFKSAGYKVQKASNSQYLAFVRK